MAMEPGSYTDPNYCPDEITILVVKEPASADCLEEEEMEDDLLLTDPQVQEDLRQSAVDIAEGNLFRWKEVAAPKKQ